MKLSCLAGWMISILLFCNYSHAQEFPFEKTFKSDYNHSIYNVHKTAAGNLLISTLSKPTDYLSSLSHAFLFDSLGNKLWVKDSSNPNFSVIENYLENREEIIFHGTAHFCAMDVIDYFYEWVFLRTDDSGMNYQYLSFYLPDSHELNG